MQDNDSEYEEKVQYDPNNVKFGKSNANVKSRQTSSVQHQQMKHKPDLEPQRYRKQQIHTADSIQDDLLEKIKTEAYRMNIAPSDLVDFGGQRSFDMTHQLFIQQKGTFILMFDGLRGLDTKLVEYPQGDVTAACKLLQICHFNPFNDHNICIMNHINTWFLKIY